MEGAILPYLLFTNSTLSSQIQIWTRTRLCLYRYCRSLCADYKAFTFNIICFQSELSVDFLLIVDMLVSKTNVSHQWCYYKGPCRGPTWYVDVSLTRVVAPMSRWSQDQSPLVPVLSSLLLLRSACHFSIHKIGLVVGLSSGASVMIWSHPQCPLLSWWWWWPPPCSSRWSDLRLDPTLTHS